MSRRRESASSPSVADRCTTFAEPDDRVERNPRSQISSPSRPAPKNPPTIQRQRDPAASGLLGITGSPDSSTSSGGLAGKAAPPSMGDAASADPASEPARSATEMRPETIFVHESISSGSESVCCARSTSVRSATPHIGHDLNRDIGGLERASIDCARPDRFR